MKFKILVATLLLTVSLMGQKKEGVASYYHDKYHGRLAANGTVFSQDSMTCAHRTLPFGTRLKVQNIDNNKTVEVVVTDRGPFIKGREIDLSRAAADSIGMIQQGLQRVEFEIIK